MTAPHVLAVEHLAKSFSGYRAVDDVSFAIHAGEVVALIGPNGAGKTTTFNMINGQIAPDHGRVTIGGEDVTGVRPEVLWRRGVARTFQITATFASMTVLENVLVALASREGAIFTRLTLDSALEAEALSLLGEVGMAELAGRQCGLLAYGDLKRVELALALVNRPHLLLMDEPTAGMAPGERGKLMQLVTRMSRERRTSVLFTEHDMDIVFGHADRILVMNHGRLIAAGRPEEVRSNPHVREVYLGHGTTAGQ